MGWFSAVRTSAIQSLKVGDCRRRLITTSCIAPRVQRTSLVSAYGAALCGRPICARDESPMSRISSFPEKSSAFTDARHWLVHQSVSPFYREVGNERNLSQAGKQVFSAKDRLDLEVDQRPPVSLWRKPSGKDISETCRNVRNHAN